MEYDRFYYDKDGEYYCYFGKDGELQNRMASVAVAFDADRERDGAMATMFKHGEPEQVHEWAREHRQTLNETGAACLEEVAMDLMVIESSDWEVEELNKIIHSANYIGKFVRDGLVGVYEDDIQEY